MAESDTAVLEPGTADVAPDTEQPQFAEVEDTADDTPDTEDAPETPDTEDEQPKGLTPEEVEARVEERLKAERERWDAEIRSSPEEKAREAAATERRTQAQQLRSGQVAQALANVAKWSYDQAEQGKEFRFDPRSVQQIALQMEGAVFQDQSDQWAHNFNAYLSQNFDGFKPSLEVTQQLTAAFRDWRPNDAVAAQFAAMREAVRAQEAPKLREEIEAAVRAELSAAGKTAAMKQNDAARAAQPKPTGVGTTGGGRSALNFKTQLEADTAFAAGKITLAQVKQVLEKNLPYS